MTNESNQKRAAHYMDSLHGQDSRQTVFCQRNDVCLRVGGLIGTQKNENMGCCSGQALPESPLGGAQRIARSVVNFNEKKEGLLPSPGDIEMEGKAKGSLSKT